MLVYCMNLTKILERYLRVNLLGPGPRFIKKEFTGPRSHKGSETLVYTIYLKLALSTKLVLRVECHDHSLFWLPRNLLRSLIIYTALISTAWPLLVSPRTARQCYICFKNIYSLGSNLAFSRLMTYIYIYIYVVPHR